MQLDAYTRDALDLVIALVNSDAAAGGAPADPASPTGMEALLKRHRMLGPNRVSARDVDDIHRLRQRFRAVFEAPSVDAAATELNTVLADARVVPNIATSARGERYLHFAPGEASLARRVAADAGIGLAFFLCDNPDRLGVCAAAPCRNVFVDVTKNHSRRYCSETCGSRATVAALRARRRSD